VCVQHLQQHLSLRDRHDSPHEIREMCCSVLQCVVVCCSVLQCVAVRISDFVRFK